MTGLPSGTVTFLLTDVEGSTRLWESDGAVMPQAMDRHDAIVEGCVEVRDGVVIKERGEGDSRFAVFANAADAVAAAVAIQTELAEEEWPTESEIRVRIGLHTGFAHLRDGDYYGSVVNRCARVRSLGYGGQTLLTAGTHEVVKDDPLPERTTMRDLGEHRLKDLTEPEHVFQLVVDGLPYDFPPLKSLGSTTNNLPEQLTEFYGRERELAEARSLLADSRLLTILAPGGTGKTRLALQLAAELSDAYPQGVFFVELAPVESVDDVVQAVAEAIGVPMSSDQSARDQLLQYLAGKRQLLVMDNFEHLAEGATLVTDVLRAAPGVDVLVTSRAKLNVTGETVLQLRGLETEWDAPQQALEASSVQLFVDTAQRVDSSFALSEEDLGPLREILTVVHGMPLGIMLSAAWADVLPISEIAGEIRKSLDFLESELKDLPERHASMRAVFDYSWALLDETERKAFAALSVFRGGFTREAADVVAGASLRTLAGLASKSFLTSDRRTGRFSVHELLRQYGADELAADPERFEGCADRHASFYADLMATAFDVIRESDQPKALRMMDADVDNIRAALRRCLEQQRVEDARKFLEPMWFLYEARGWFPAAQIFGDAAAAFAGHEDGPGAVVASLSAGLHAWFLALQSQPERGAELAADAVAGLRATSDVSALALALQARCLGTMYSGRMEEYQEAAAEALDLTADGGDAWAEAVAETWAIFAYLVAERLDDAVRIATKALNHLVATNEHWSRTFVHTAAAYIAVAEGRPRDVLEEYRQSAQLSREIAYVRGLQWALNGLGDAAAGVGDFEVSTGHYRESLELSYDLGQVREMLGVLTNIARVRGSSGAPEEAVELLSTILADPTGSQQLPMQPASIHAIAEEVRAEYAAELEPADYAAAVERGRAQTTEAVVEELLTQV